MYMLCGALYCMWDLYTILEGAATCYGQSGFHYVNTPPHFLQLHLGAQVIDWGITGICVERHIHHVNIGLDSPCHCWDCLKELHHSQEDKSPLHRHRSQQQL